MVDLKNTQVVRFDFYADRLGMYENKYFAFKVNYPFDFEVFVINTFYKFRRQGNKMKAMFLVYGNGYSEQITPIRFVEIFQAYKQKIASYRAEKEQSIFIKSIESELKRKGYL